MTRPASSSWDRLVLATLTVLVASCAADEPAQLVISNARVVTGTGEVLEQAALVVRNGRIERVARSDDLPDANHHLDLDGGTVLPGLIDVHRHFLPYSGATSESELAEHIATAVAQTLEGLLTAGLTTVMSPGDGLAELIEIRGQVERGELLGPRLLTAGPVFTAPGDHPAGGPVCNEDPFCRSRYAVEVDDPELARRRVRELAQQGADFIKVAIDRGLVPSVTIEEPVLEAISSEAEVVGLPMIVHAENTADVANAIALGADRLVHTPGQGSFAELADDARAALRAVPMATTVSWVTRRNAEAMGDTEWGGEGEYRQMLANIRALLDQGGSVAFGTDNPPALGSTDFMTEVEALGTVLTTAEVIHALTLGAAQYLQIDDRLGSIEPGKVADLVVLGGDPLRDLSALGDVRVVVVGGEIAVDRR